MANITMSDDGTTKSMAKIGMEYFEFVRHDMWEIYARPEVNSWPLMPGGPWTTALIVIAYALFTLVFGPMYMKNRKAFNIKQLIIGFDVFLVIYNTALVLIGKLKQLILYHGKFPGKLPGNYIRIFHRSSFYTS